MAMLLKMFDYAFLCIRSNCTTVNVQYKMHTKHEHPSAILYTNVRTLRQTCIIHVVNRQKLLRPTTYTEWED